MFPYSTFAFKIALIRKLLTPWCSRDISSMLASESGAEWRQLGKDGFVMDDADFTAPLWSVNWDQQDGSVAL